MTTSHRLFVFVLCLLGAAGLAAPPPAHAGWFSPDFEPLAPDQLQQKLRAEPVVFNASGVKLEVRTKTAAIGSFVLGSLLSSAAASGGRVTSMRDLQAQTDIVMKSSETLQRAGAEVAAMAHGESSSGAAFAGPLPLVVQALQSLLSGLQITVSPEPPLLPQALQVNLVQSAWGLDYAMLSSEYTLRGDLTLEIVDKKQNKIYLRHRCGAEPAQKQLLEDWERNAQEALKMAAEEIARRCTAEFAAAMDVGR